MELDIIDWVIVIAFFAISLMIGVLTSKRAGKSSEDFFLSGRKMPWWLLGVSMVATTFAADTPGLVTNIVREDGGGVFGNWVWWSMLLTGMLTVFFYARLWRKSGVTTDLEFYEMRYSGKAASFLRGFRAVYLGVIFNVITMAGVCLAGIKISHVLLGFEPWETLLIAGSITAIYSMLGGLKSVLLTDFFQFIIAMVGSIWATVYIVNMPEIGGMDKLLVHPELTGKLDIFPDFSNWEILIPLFIVPLAVQWWSTWYPGAEPGGGGYIAQRMLAAKDEKHATWAVLFFNFAHYALRPWPWIIVGLASIIVFPSLASLQQEFPELGASFIGHDLAYSAMLTYLPVGLLGIVVTSLIAAFMSTISTQLNWGSSYVVNDLYKRFINKEATDKQQVVVGRVSTILLMVLAAVFSLFLENAMDVFGLMLQIGAGTGLLFILRWFWKRINPYSEIAAMIISFLVAIVFFVNGKLETKLFDIAGHWELVIGVLITTIGWVTVTLLTDPTDDNTIAQFEKKIFEEDGVIDKFKNFKYKISGFFFAVVGVYSALFTIGYIIYGEAKYAVFCGGIFLFCAAVIAKYNKKIFS